MSDGATGPALSVQDMTIRFGGVTAVAGASFEVPSGSVQALIGPNGAGKSSCFNGITGVYQLQGGVVRHRGDRIDRFGSADIAGRGIARTFQNLALPQGLTVYDCMRVARHHRTRSGLLSTALGLPRARRERRRDDEVIRSAARDVGIEDVLHRRVDVLPYGTKKRVELARALCAEPTLLLLDEPVAGISESETATMAETVLRIRDQYALTILLVEHDMTFVMTISDRVVVLHSGHVIADGTPSAVQADPAVIAAYLGEPAEPHLLTQAGVKHDQTA